jgi:hypothetical protein
MKPELAHPNPEPTRFRLTAIVRILLLTAAAILFALHFLHLNADFPNHSPWSDWSKYTDEGWYGDAAIRHYLFGHWYFKGDFNPAVALPIWPAIELLAFRFTGVSPAAARSLTLCVFALTLVTFYRLIQLYSRPRTRSSGPSLAAPIAMLLLCASPFFYVFERMAILEPLLIALTALALLTASHLHPLLSRRSEDLSSRPERSAVERPPYSSVAPSPSHLGTQTSTATKGSTSAANTAPLNPGPWGLSPAVRFLPTIALGLILPAMVLTKTTAIFLIPAIAYIVWARAGYRLRPALKLSIIPAIMAITIWLAYFLLIVRPHYLEDYRYLFSANAYTGIELAPYATVILNTITDGAWMGHILYPFFFIALALAIFWRPRLFNNPLFPSLLLWAGGYFAFLAYHNNLQPRYYLVAAAPITVVVALAIESFRQATTRTARIASSTLAAIVVLAIAVPDTITQLDFILHPDYTFLAAANAIKRIVLADPTHSHLILSISGSDLTLMTGLPSIDDDFGTLDLDKRVQQYRPGWYIAWNELDDDKMDALTPLYHVERVAAFPAMDDPDRNLLILYRLDLLAPAPTSQTPTLRTHKPHIPKPLVTKIGQQPSPEQLEH